MWQAKSSTEKSLSARHLARIGLVIEPCKVEQPVKDQNFDLYRERMSLVGCLALSRGDADGHVAGHFCGNRTISRKREYISGFILAPETAVQCANCLVSGKHHVYLPTQANGGLRLGKEIAQGTSRGQAAVAFGCVGNKRGGALLHCRCWVGVQIWVENNHACEKAPQRRTVAEPLVNSNSTRTANLLRFSWMQGLGLVARVVGLWANFDSLADAKGQFLLLRLH